VKKFFWEWVTQARTRGGFAIISSSPGRRHCTAFEELAQSTSPAIGFAPPSQILRTTCTTTAAISEVVDIGGFLDSCSPVHHIRYIPFYVLQYCSGTSISNIPTLHCTISSGAAFTAKSGATRGPLAFDVD
jgi:hypothetical protein